MSLCYYSLMMLNLLTRLRTLEISNQLEQEEQTKTIRKFS